jgi:hypothetical protein
MWKLANTWPDPTSKAGQQRGFPAPGSGAQYSGARGREPGYVPWEALQPTKGIRSWFRPASPRSGQQGFASPGNAAQERPAGSMPNDPPIYGQAIEVYTPYFSRGAAAYVQNYGKVLTNPIGAGIVATSRPQASYGQSGQYANGAIWWANQVIPTSINIQGLTDPEALAEIVGSLNVEAMVRTTG